MNPFDTMSLAETVETRKRRRDAMTLQEVEGNPLTSDEVEMFEMFEREAWSHERRHAHILERLKAKYGR